ncbi:MAG: 16S rRNA (guanine(527)-N(7))-methyltransferase RsmG [Oscillospiraceae bacterium]
MNITKELISLAEEMKISVTQEQAEQFQIYFDLLLCWNEKINLTAITEPHEILVKHFIDSLCFLKAVDCKQGAKIIDVGTGAGFPGIPVKIIRPDVELCLLDGLNKRLLFLQEVAKELHFHADFVHKRAEEAGKMPEMREKFDIATARAVAKMSTLCEYCLPLVKMKGSFVAMKGPGLSAELAEAQKAISLLGGKVEKIEKFILPDEEGSERNIAILQKNAFTPKEYPRHGNKIAKSPL